MRQQFLTHVSFRHTSLKWYFVAFILLPLTLISAFAIYFSFKQTEAELEKHLEQQVELVGRALRYPISREIMGQEGEKIDRVFRSAQNIKRIYTINLYGKEGELIWSSNKDILPQEKKALEDTIEDDDRKKEYTEINKKEVYSFFEPIKADNGDVLGLIQLTRKKSDMESEIKDAKRNIILGLGGAFLTVVFLSTLIYSRAIHQPIKALANKLSDVDLSRLVDQNYVHVEGPREFEVVEEAINRMLNRLKSSERQIKDEQQEQLRLRDKVKQSEKLAAIGQLSAGVAHDLGNPLSAIDATIQHIKRQKLDSSKLETHINNIQNETGRMESIINQLLDYSDHNKLDDENLELCSFISKKVERYREKHKNIRIEFNSGKKDMYFWGNSNRLSRMLENLLDNACNVLFYNNVSDPSIHVKLDSKEDHLRLSIEDNGIGLSKEERSKIFDPFYTSKKNNSSRNKGLGLAIVQGIVQSYSGEIYVKDSSLGGARFVIELPISQEDTKSEGNKDG